MIVNFISGLPRSGSTLLAAVLKQNPRFHHIGMTSPVGGFFTALLGKMVAINESAIFINPEQRRSVLRGVFESYYADHQDKVVFDTNRIWCAKLSAIVDIWPNAKIIACVRQCGHIMDSIERVIQNNALEPAGLVKFDPCSSVYQRAQILSAHDGLMGFSWGALKEAYHSEHADRLMLLRYETLTSSPKTAVDAVYEFMGEQLFPHDFNNIAVPDFSEHDARVGTPGLHRLKHMIAPQMPRVPIIPPDLFAKCQIDNFWENPKLNSRNVKVI